MQESYAYYCDGYDHDTDCPDTTQYWTSKTYEAYGRSLTSTQPYGADGEVYSKVVDEDKKGVS